MENRHRRRWSALGNCKLKQRYTTAHLLCVCVQSLSHVWVLATPCTAARQASLSSLSPGHIIRMAKMQKTDNTKCCWGCRTTKLSFIAGVNAKWYSHFERQLVVSYHRVQQLCPWYLSKWFESIYPHKNLHKKFMEIYRSFLNNCQNLEATKVLFSRWTDQ